MRTLSTSALIERCLFGEWNIAPQKVSKNNYEADLVTISVHEITHYLARKLCEDFNFSSPFQFKPDCTTSTPGKDVEINEKFLELGRKSELILCDKIQPSVRKKRQRLF